MSIYPRQNYEMSAEDLKILLDAMSPQPVMKIGAWTGLDQQERANAAWAALGAKMGFEPMSAQPIYGKGNQHFSAIPAENEVQKAERLAKDAEDAKQAEIARLNREKAAIDVRLSELIGAQ